MHQENPTLQHLIDVLKYADSLLVELSSEDDLLFTEKELGLQLPADYRMYLKEAGLSSEETGPTQPGPVDPEWPESSTIQASRFVQKITGIPTMVALIHEEHAGVVYYGIDVAEPERGLWIFEEALAPEQVEYTDYESFANFMKCHLEVEYEMVGEDVLEDFYESQSTQE